MQERIIMRRLNVRERLAFVLVAGLVISLLALLWLLNEKDPNPALTTLLGAAVGAEGTGLVTVVNAISATDKQDPGGADEPTEDASG